VRFIIMARLARALMSRDHANSDWAASQFLSQQFSFGVVGYVYKEIGCDSGSGEGGVQCLFFAICHDDLPTFARPYPSLCGCDHQISPH
jgi:hypothetical protein